MSDTGVQNLYPEQLTEVVQLIELLNSFTKDHEKTISVGTEIKIFDDDGTVLLGFIVDEIGGAWSFRAATTTDCLEHGRQ